MSAMSAAFCFEGFLAADLPLLNLLVPLLPARPGTIHGLLRVVSECGLSSSFTGLRSRAANGSNAGLFRRLAALQLQRSPSGCICAGGRVLLPLELWPLAADLAALKSFVSRDSRRALNPEAALAVLAETHFAAGQLFGCLSLRAVRQRLRGGLRLLLARLLRDSEELTSEAQTLLSPLSFSVSHSPKELSAFSCGEVRYIILPGLPAALLALPEFSSSTMVSVGERALTDGSIKCTFRCHRAASTPAASCAKCSLGALGGHSCCGAAIEIFKPATLSPCAWLLIRVGAHKHELAFSLLPRGAAAASDINDHDFIV